MSNGDLTVDGNLYVTGFINGDGASNSNGTGITNLAAGNFATTFEPNDALAGSLSGDGSVTFRPLTGSDLPLASATELGILVPDLYSLAPPPNSLTGLSAQGWHTDVFGAPYMIDGFSPADALVLVDDTIGIGIPHDQDQPSPGQRSMVDRRLLAQAEQNIYEADAIIGSMIAIGATDPATPDGQNYVATLQRREVWIAQANYLRGRIALNDQLAAAEEDRDGEMPAPPNPMVPNRAARRHGRGRS